MPAITKPPPILNKYDPWLALSIGLASLILYTRTLVPGLALGDSAEFQTLSYTLGMSHPTGYPVYLLLGKMFSLLPIGEIAYRINLLSAVCAAAATALIYLTARLLGAGRIAALAGGAGFALAGVLWTQAVTAEVYAPSAMMLSAILFCLLAWWRFSSCWWLALAGFLGGLSLGVHNTVILAAPAVLLYLILRARRWVDWMGAIFGLCLGLLCWFSAFLLIDAQNTPTSYYESVARVHLSGWDLTKSDFDTPLKRLSFMLTGIQFQQSMFSGSPNAIEKSIGSYRRTLESDFSWALCMLAAVGFILPFLRYKWKYAPGWQEGALFLIGYLVTLFFVLNYRIPDIYVFYIPTYVYLCILSALGMSGMVHIVGYCGVRLGMDKPAQLNTIQIVTSLMLLFVVLLPKTPTIAQAWKDTFYQHPLRLGNQQVDSDAIKRRAIKITSMLEDDAILFTKWMELYTYFYVSYVEGERTNMHFHEIHPSGTGSGLNDSMQEYIQQNIHNHPIYVSYPIPGLRRLYQLTPIGNQLFRMQPRLEP